MDDFRGYLAGLSLDELHRLDALLSAGIHALGGAGECGLQADLVLEDGEPPVLIVGLAEQAT